MARNRDRPPRLLAARQPSMWPPAYRTPCSRRPPAPAASGAGRCAKKPPSLCMRASHARRCV